MSLLLALTGSVAPPAPDPVVSLGGGWFDAEEELYIQESMFLMMRLAVIAIAAAGGFDG
jgi:hypothetical protein